MKYPSELLRKADDILSERRQRADYELRQRRETLRQEHPEVYAAYRDINTQGALLGKRVVTCNKEEAEQLLAEHQALAETLPQALAGAGLEEDYLSIRHLCPLCGDRGYIDGKSCDCRNAILNRLAHEWLSNFSKVDDCSFDNFQLDYYQGETVKAMERLLTSCRRYAAGFTLRSPSLLFLGPPGLGKTHLSLAIAGQVVNQGHLVLYASAPRLLERLVDISFNNEADDEYQQIAFGCDLLVIDDLGTEFQTRFTRSEVYSLINTRLTEGRPTIINTNLTLKELEACYEERVLSRLVGEYKVNQFTGKDIRLQQRMESIQRRNPNG